MNYPSPEYPQPLMWVDKRGRGHLPVDMDTEYLKNAIAFMENRKDILIKMKEELARREEDAPKRKKRDGRCIIRVVNDMGGKGVIEATHPEGWCAIFWNSRGAKEMPHVFNSRSDAKDFLKARERLVGGVDHFYRIVFLVPKKKGFQFVAQLNRPHYPSNKGCYFAVYGIVEDLKDAVVFDSYIEAELALSIREGEHAKTFDIIKVLK